MFSFALLMVLISSPLMVEPCGNSPNAGGNSGTTATTTTAGGTTASTTLSPEQQQQQDSAVAESNAKLDNAKTIMANAGVDSDKVNAELATYANDPVHMDAVKDIVKNNLPSTVTEAEYNEISSQIQGKFESGELSALESYQLILTKINAKAGADAADLTAKVNVYFNKPEHLVKLQDIIKAQNPNADPSVATAVADALKAT